MFTYPYNCLYLSNNNGTDVIFHYEDFSSNTPKFKVIGQILKTYIVLEGTDSLILLDQHAAHEKILFEKYFSDYGRVCR